MIRNYSDHSANERTFLSWVRTGIAVIAFGFVVEKFNLFMLTLARSLAPEEHGAQLQRSQAESAAMKASPLSPAEYCSSCWQRYASRAPRA